MAAPPPPPRQSTPDADDPAPSLEERSVSYTRRLGSNSQASMDLQASMELTSNGDLRVDLSSLELTSNGDVRVDLSELEAARAAQPGHAHASGDVIAGKYRLQKIIGKGGMGAVWQAHNIPLDIDIAIKLIRRDRTAPEAAGRLLQEARAAARLKHPSIVRVFDFGESEKGDPFIVMELLHGEGLGAILRRKSRLTAAVAVQTLLPVASALASAHSKGIVHRDLKPDNILIVTDETGSLVPKVVDFGIAKLLSNDIDRQVTLAGEVLGSPDYMSPEQARGAENVGEATDVWAFCVVLYEALTGKRPFDGPNYNALIAAILTTPPERIPAHLIDPALWAIIERGLAKDTSARWPRMRDLGAALAAWAVERGLEEDVAGGSISRQWLSGAAKRLLTVMPENDEEESALRAGAPPAAPAGGASASSSAAASPTGSHRRAQQGGARAIIWVVAAVSVAGLGAAAIFARGELAALLPSSAPIPSTSASAPATTAAATATVAAAPSAEPAPPAASASAPSPQSGARQAPRPAPRKPKAPAAPKHIKF